MAETYIFEVDSAERILGPNDRNLSYLELILGSDLAVRGDSLTCFKNNPVFVPLMKRLEERGKERGREEREDRNGKCFLSGEMTRGAVRRC